MSSYWDGFWTGIAVAFLMSQLYFLYTDIINGKIKRREKPCHTKAESEEKRQD